MATNLLNLLENMINLLIKEDKWTKIRRNIKRPKPRFIVDSLLKDKDKENFESSRRKATHYIHEEKKKIVLRPNLSSKPVEAKKQCYDISKMLTNKTKQPIHPKLPHSPKVSFKNKG